ncbi:hypothetical protein AALO_G00013010 [Alosa alosa]|uniref:Uncharacterized protein n=1 Tax=Alosa alosa TaxID=278164 RepID=A0AAV6HJ34_9TELE|nr:hypothetical protein AALO_G00013010 [Alosa alosa]
MPEPLCQSRHSIGCWKQEMQPLVAAEETRCQSNVQHIPAQIGGPSQTGLGGLLFTKQLPCSRTTTNELNGLLTPLELRKVQLYIALLQGIC